jgi:hypothetical protein
MQLIYSYKHCKQCDKDFDVSDIRFVIFSYRQCRDGGTAWCDVDIFVMVISCDVYTFVMVITCDVDSLVMVLSCDENNFVMVTSTTRSLTFVISPPKVVRRHRVWGRIRSWRNRRQRAIVQSRPATLVQYPLRPTISYQSWYKMAFV